MTEATYLQNPLVSLTTFKREPSKVNEKSKEAKTGVYVLNNSEVATVVVAPEVYQELVKKATEWDSFYRGHLAQLHDEAEKELKKTDAELLSSRDELNKATEALFQEALNE